MLQQYLQIKGEHPDCLLMYRMGDFYEMFFEDAVTAARELQIALTSRNRDKDSPDAVPMCGVPWHALQGYLAQLVDKGYRVAICDQVEDPKQASGLVKRAVTRIVTSGTVLDDANLEAKSHNYLGALYWDADKKQGGFAWADVSTGQWSGLQGRKQAELWQWVQKLAPRELLLPEDCTQPTDVLLDGVHCHRVPLRPYFDAANAARRLREVQQVQELSALGLDDKAELTRACGALLTYMQQTQMQDMAYLQAFVPLELGRHLIVDELTERNLEIFTRLNGRRGAGTLRHVLDATITPMGGRLLEERLRHPWRERKPIEDTQDAVAFLLDTPEVRQELRDALDAVYDLERLTTRITLNRATPRDFVALRDSLEHLPAVLAALTRNPDGGYPTATHTHCAHTPTAIYRATQEWDTLEDCATLLRTALVDDPPHVITDGGLFRPGFNAALDALLELSEHGEQRLQAMLATEQAATGLAKLKLGYNRVFGYYFELSRANIPASLPAHFERRQSLVNGERFTTTALKELEEQLLSAADSRKTLEYELFQELRAQVCAVRHRVLFMAELIAQLDYWQALAHSAERWHWTRPQVADDASLCIRGGRHPVVEAIIGAPNFVPNDFILDDKRRLCLITGPNMAGKSTVLRQTAIICLMAQMGSFVPASEARIGLVDRIFSRVGASDNLAQGQSTFMVEMMETARILRQSSRRSLVILDEIGRGTSTYDGLALAWAVVEELVRRNNGDTRTLFATHYHELTALEGQLPRVFTMNIAIREVSGEIVFLHKLVPGPSDRSYGVEVARLAGVPLPVVQRARTLLQELERSREGLHTLPSGSSTLTLPGMEPPAATTAPPPSIVGLEPQREHPLLQALRDVQPERLSPMDALKLLHDWKLLWGREAGNTPEPAPEPDPTEDR